MIRVAAAALLALGVASPGSADPHVDYMLQCQGCHLSDGTGSPGEVPDLTDEIDRLLRVPGGREYLAQVPGAALSPLDDARLAAVLNWMVARFGGPEPGVAFEPFARAEVGRLRRGVLLDASARRAELLAASATRATP